MWLLEKLKLPIICICGGIVFILDWACLEGGGWCLLSTEGSYIPQEISDFSTVVRLTPESEFSGSVGGLHIAMA